MHRLLVIVGCAAGVALTSIGCATVRSAETAAAKALISPQEEQQLGVQMHQELQKQGVKYVEDPVVLARVNEIAKPIFALAKKERPEFDYRIYVIDNPGTVNAFATPGGFVYIESGLLQAVDTEAELAGVIAHETGHITRRHAARNMVNQFGIQTVAALALGQNPSLLEQVGASVASQGTILAHSRAEETEADEAGVVFASQAGYDPRGLVGFLGKLGAMSGHTPRALTWLSTHPSSEDRVAHLQSYIQQHDLTGSGGHQSLAELQRRLPQQGAGGGGGGQQPPP